MTFERIRLFIYEFLAAPAHCWLWIIANILGYEFTCGLREDDEDEE